MCRGTENSYASWRSSWCPGRQRPCNKSHWKCAQRQHIFFSINCWWICPRWGMRWVWCVKARGNTEHVMASVCCRRPDRALITASVAAAQTISIGEAEELQMQQRSRVVKRRAASVTCLLLLQNTSISSWTPSLFCSFRMCDNPNDEFSGIYHDWFHWEMAQM